MVEYAFLITLIATIMIGVLALAGRQLETAFNDIRTDVSVAISGGSAYPQLAQPHNCQDGGQSQYRHNKWRCNDE